MSALTELVAETLKNPMVAGMGAAAVAGSLAFSARALPAKLWQAAKDLLSVTLVVQGDDELYRSLNLWLSRHGRVDRSQRLMVQSEYDYEAGAWGWQITLGAGWHLLWIGRRPMFVFREVKDAEGLGALLGGQRSHRLHLVSPGRAIQPIRRMVEAAERIYHDDGLVKIHFWHSGGYMLADRRPPRSLDTVFLPPAQKARLVEDVRAFADAKAEYRRRGTPYRRGYLFEGPPGTGKTSLIFALAGVLERSIYVINLAAVSSDNDLMAAFNEVGKGGVVVIEDIDAADISHDRAAPKAAPAAVVVTLGAPSENAKASLTLSGLLNAIDGVAAREGRMMFVTSNHAEKLDPALLRAGRIDMREVIGPLDEACAWEMFKAFRPDSPWSEFATLVLPRLPLAAAEVQNLLQGADTADRGRAAA